MGTQLQRPLRTKKKAFSRGALLLSRMDGDDLPRPVNSDSIKKYYAQCTLFFFESIKFGCLFSLHLVYFTRWSQKTQQQETFFL